MKNNKKIIILSFLLGMITTSHSTEAIKITYKWVENGGIKYSNILPAGVTDYIELDGRGIVIEKELPKQTTTPIKVEVNPNIDSPVKLEVKEEKTLTKVEQKALDEEQYKKNCKLAKNNLKALKKGNVKNSLGKKLTTEEIEKTKKEMLIAVKSNCEKDTLSKLIEPETK